MATLIQMFVLSGQGSEISNHFLKELNFLKDQFSI